VMFRSFEAATPACAWDCAFPLKSCIPSFVGMCGNKVATTCHLIGTAVRGYVAQSTGPPDELGFLTKTIRNRIAKANKSYSLGFERIDLRKSLWRTYPIQ
jgi:hypothetical protein